MLKGISGAALLGAVMFALGEQPILVRALLGGIAGAATFVAVPPAISWILDRVKPVEVSISCSSSVMPSKAPEGGYTIVRLYPGGGGSAIPLGETGSATGFAGTETAYKCEVRNQSGGELPALRITLPVRYRAIPGRLEIDETKLSGKISIIAPYLDARSERPFYFYIPDPKDFAATISGIEVSYARPTQRDRAIKVTNNVVHPVAFGPAE